MDHDKFITTLSLENLQQHARDQHLFEEYMCNEVNKKDAEIAGLRAQFAGSQSALTKALGELTEARAELEQARAEIERLKASYTVATWRCTSCGRTHPITASECGCYFERMKITTGSSTTQAKQAGEA